MVLRHNMYVLFSVCLVATDNGGSIRSLHLAFELNTFLFYIYKTFQRIDMFFMNASVN